MTLKEIIQEAKKEIFLEDYEASDAETLGILISEYFEWNGQEIFECAYNAFEDSNFHEFNEKFKDIWRNEK